MTQGAFHERLTMPVGPAHLGEASDALGAARRLPSVLLAMWNTRRRPKRQPQRQPQGGAGTSASPSASPVRL
jgi:hypothetical protein